MGLPKPSSYTISNTHLEHLGRSWRDYGAQPHESSPTPTHSWGKYIHKNGLGYNMGAKQPFTYGLTCEYCSSKGPLFVIEHFDKACSDYIVCEKHREMVLESFRMMQEV